MDGATAILIFVGLGVLLGGARVGGELARKLDQPFVLGEILAGVFLGPTLMGTFFPQIVKFYPTTGPTKNFFEGFTYLAVTLFLMVAGMEMNLPSVIKKKQAALFVSLSGIIVPFAIGYTLAWHYPVLLGIEQGINPNTFALFFGTALAISALPVIAKILMDIGLYKSEVGSVIMAAAVFDDLAGWILFSCVVGANTIRPSGAISFPLLTLLYTLLFAITTMIILRPVLRKLFTILLASKERTIGVGLVFTFLFAAITQWIGIHSLFGAFIAGIILGDSGQLTDETRQSFKNFISSFFTPVFFASIGLRANFATHFDLILVILIISVACIGKIFGCGIAARFAGMTWNKALSVGVGMNARGAMEIVLGLIAFQNGIITEKLFVALVIMAMITSVMVSPLMKYFLIQRRKA